MKQEAKFQSTLPVRGATLTGFTHAFMHTISIHAPRAGSDLQDDVVFVRFRAHFNPRSPCGERHLRCGAGCAAKRFQSTLPVRGATMA